MASHQNLNSELKEQISSYDDRIEFLEGLNQQLKGTVKAKEAETTEASHRNQLRSILFFPIFSSLLNKGQDI